jgi:hypothetical protein
MRRSSDHIHPSDHIKPSRDGNHIHIRGKHIAALAIAAFAIVAGAVPAQASNHTANQSATHTHTAN